MVLITDRAVFISPISNDIMIIYCIAVFLYIHWTLCFIQSVLMYCYAALLPIGGGRILRRTLSVCPSVPLLFTLQ